MAIPHRKNVPGDFYVEDGCCTSCDVPMLEAPELFTYDVDASGSHHCYVSRQPADESELDDMLNTISCAEFECIHYAGRDDAILARMKQINAAHLCDAIDLPPKPVRQWWRFW